jgi:hypothetical protein
LILLSAFAQPAQAQIDPLKIFQTYFVTGDYVVGGWVEGAPDGSGFAPGTISIPDIRQPSQNGVPAVVPKGAEVVAAYLYWATVEGSQSLLAGKNGFFNNYPIVGSLLGNPNAPTSWSAGGCSGSAQGSKTMRTYRADVRPYLPLDADPTSQTFGTVLGNGSISVRLADSGNNGNTAPFTLGATLVIIYRVVSPTVPLNSIVLYDGAFAPNNSGQSFSQAIIGFYQAAASPVAKITHIVGNGQGNKSENVFLKSVNLPSLYPGRPPFPGIYNNSWDNPTWLPNKYGAAVSLNDSTATTSVLPAASNSGCVSWGTIIFSTPVQDTDNDGLLDVWEDHQGYTDAVSGQAVALPGADKLKKDLFVEVDYLTTLLDPGADKHSHLPKQAAIDMVGNAFAAQNINVHFDLGQNIYPGDPFVIGSGNGGNAISESALACADTPAALCQFPGQPAIGWKGGLLYVRDNATVPNTNIPLGNFQAGRNLSYHYLVFGHSLGEPRSFWSTAGTALLDSANPQLISLTNSGNTATLKIQTPAGVLKPGDCPSSGFPECNDANANRLTVGGALTQLAVNGTYTFNVTSQSTDAIAKISTTILTIGTSGVADGTLDFGNEPQ